MLYVVELGYRNVQKMTTCSKHKKFRNDQFLTMVKYMSIFMIK